MLTFYRFISLSNRITNLPQELNFADWTEEELKSLDNLFILLRVQSGEELPSFAIVEGNRLMDKFTFLAPDEKAVIVLISDTLSHIVKERQHLRNVLVTKQGISDVKGELVTLGPNNTTVSRKVLLKMDWTNCRQVTRALLRATFTRETLSTHSLTGKPSPGKSSCTYFSRFLLWNELVLNYSNASFIFQHLNMKINKQKNN